MKLGISTAAFYGRWETEEAARVIASLPVDCAEVFLQSAGEYEKPFARLVKENLGCIPCTSMHPSGILFENQMFGRSARQRQEAYDLFERALDAAQILGAQCYVYHGRNTAQLKPLPFHLQANIDMIGCMNELASKRGLAIAWENVFWCQLTTCERVIAVREACPEARFTLDIKQAMRAGEDPCAMAQAMGDALLNVHACDWDGQGKLCLPGEGVFDFGRFAGVLHDMGYDGPVIVEPYLALIGSDEALHASLEYMKQILDSADRDCFSD